MSENLPPCSEKIKSYFDDMEEKLQEALAVAKEARKKGYDPEDKVDIPIARNMAERVEGLISIVAPQIVGSGMTKRIKELEDEYGALDWRVALKIAEEVAKEKFCKFKDKKEAMEVGIRVGMAYNTAGIVAAPLEGFVEIKIKKRNDGKEYLASCYAGPIRGAGGTAAAFSVIVSDYVRVKMGLERYDPTEMEIERITLEAHDYHERVTNLQYLPSEQELRFFIANLPVEVSGDPTEKIEVSNYKDQPRIETNQIRGGVCLVMAEGLCQKAKKLWKRLGKWGKEFDLEWNFLKDFLELQSTVRAKEKKDDSNNSVAKKIKPNYTYIADIVAGRPVLSYPMKPGGFRLRYGRSRVSGFSSASVHPSTMAVLQDFIAIGTQLKVERPGKGCALSVCDSISPPIVKLEDGSVIKLYDYNYAKRIASKVTEILFLGDILFNYGDFSENGHVLVPPGYCEEWWVQELEQKMVDLFGNIDAYKLADYSGVAVHVIEKILKSPNKFIMSAETAIKLSGKINIALHPKFLFFWSLIGLQDLMVLFNKVSSSKKVMKDEKLIKIIMRTDTRLKTILEKIGAEHVVINNEHIVMGGDLAIALLFTLGLYDQNIHESNKRIVEVTAKLAADPHYSGITVLELLSEISGAEIKDKAGTFIGARMGRPEKAKMRKMQGSPHVLFPVGEQGGRMRSFQSVLEVGGLESAFRLFYCKKCGEECLYRRCEKCDEEAVPVYYDPRSGKTVSEESEGTQSYREKKINFYETFRAILKKVGEEHYPDLIKGVRGTMNKDHIPEHISKGIFRAKHNIFVNKDGTTRYDMTELPITHFKAKEIGTSVSKLREMGYTHDHLGKPLENDEQIVEIFPQDVIIPDNNDLVDESAASVLLRVGQFLDELLVKLYGLSPFYNFKTKDDIPGTLIIGLAPHTSAGILGRIIGFSRTQGLLAHPYMHAAMRRDCDGDEACTLLLLDAFINFSRQFLPDRRGSRTMDSPLVLTSVLDPTEVDDMAHGLDVVDKYPLAFYEAAVQYKYPWEVEIEQVNERLNKPSQYENFGFVFDSTNINDGVLCSSYKVLPSMQEKLLGQMELAKKIRSVDESAVADLVINKHFLKDIKGNLRKFSQQQFRCVKCNKKYRRPPLIGQCSCGGKIIFTISEGSIVKYLGPSLELAERYNVSSYIKQTLDLLKRRVEEVFGKEKEKQSGLGEWFN